MRRSRPSKLKRRRNTNKDLIKLSSNQQPQHNSVPQAQKGNTKSDDVATTNQDDGYYNTKNNIGGNGTKPKSPILNNKNDSSNTPTEKIVKENENYVNNSNKQPLLPPIQRKIPQHHDEGLAEAVVVKNHNSSCRDIKRNTTTTTSLKRKRVNNASGKPQQIIKSNLLSFVAISSRKDDEKKGDNNSSITPASISTKAKISNNKDNDVSPCHYVSEKNDKLFASSNEGNDDDNDDELQFDFSGTTLPLFSAILGDDVILSRDYYYDCFDDQNTEDKQQQQQQQQSRRLIRHDNILGDTMLPPLPSSWRVINDDKNLGSIGNSDKRMDYFFKLPLTKDFGDDHGRILYTNESNNTTSKSDIKWSNSLLHKGDGITIPKQMLRFPTLVSGQKKKSQSSSSLLQKKETTNSSLPPSLTKTKTKANNKITNKKHRINEQQQQQQLPSAAATQQNAGLLKIISTRGATIRNDFDIDNSHKLGKLKCGSIRKFVESKWLPAPPDDDDDDDESYDETTTIVGVMRYKITLKVNDVYEEYYLRRRRERRKVNNGRNMALDDDVKFGWISDRGRLANDKYCICEVIS